MKKQKRYNKTKKAYIEKINYYQNRGMVIHEAVYAEALEILMKNFELKESEDSSEPKQDFI